MKTIRNTFKAVILLLVSTPLFAGPVYNANFSSLYTTDVTTGASTLVGDFNTVHTSFDIALNRSGQMYSVADNSTLYRVDKTNAQSTLIGVAGEFINGLAFDQNNVLYGSGGSSLYTIDVLTGLATLVMNTGFDSAGDITFDQSNKLFMTSTTNELISIDVVNATSASLGTFNETEMYGLVSVGNKLFGGTFGGDLYQIDKTNAATLFIGTTGVATAGMAAFDVPTPSLILMVLLSVFGIFRLKRHN